MAVDIVIKNCKVVSPEGISQVGVAVDNGTIVAIASDGNLPEANRTIDARGNHLLPGILDVHTHFGAVAPLADEVKDTEAAVCGGVTTINNTCGSGAESAVATSYLEKIPGWMSTWNKNSLADMVLTPVIMTDTHINDIPILAREFGISTFKFHMGRRFEVAGTLKTASTDDGLLYEAFKAIAELGAPARALVHAENMDVSSRLRQKLQAHESYDLAGWTDCRPRWVEALDVQRAISIARITGCPLHVVHTSACESVDIIARVQAEGVDVISETCPPSNSYKGFTRRAPG